MSGLTPALTSVGVSEWVSKWHGAINYLSLSGGNVTVFLLLQNKGDSVPGQPTTFVCSCTQTHTDADADDGGVQCDSADQNRSHGSVTLYSDSFNRIKTFKSIHIFISVKQIYDSLVFLRLFFMFYISILKCKVCTLDKTTFRVWIGRFDCHYCTCFMCSKFN